MREPKTLDQPAIQQYNFKRANYGEMAQYLSMYNWSEVFAGCNSVDEYWSVFYSILLSLIHRYVALCTWSHRKAKEQPAAIRKFLMYKRRAWKQWKKNPIIENKRFFNFVSRKCRRMVKEHLAQSETGLLNLPPQRFYSYVSRQLHPKENCITLCSPSGDITNNADEICKLFAAEFSKNFSTVINDTTAVIPNFSSDGDTLEFINVDFDKVRSVLL
jgi:hypothetical protein